MLPWCLRFRHCPNIPQKHPHHFKDWGVTIILFSQGNVPVNPTLKVTRFTNIFLHAIAPQNERHQNVPAGPFVFATRTCHCLYSKPLFLFIFLGGALSAFSIFFNLYVLISFALRPACEPEIHFGLLSQRVSCFLKCMWRTEERKAMQRIFYQCCTAGTANNA